MATTLKQLFSSTSKQYGDNIAITYYKDVLSYQSITYYNLNQVAKKINNILKCLHENVTDTHNKKNISTSQYEFNNKNLIPAVKSKIEEDDKCELLNVNMHRHTSFDTIENVYSTSFVDDMNTVSMLKDKDYENYSFENPHSEIDTKENIGTYKEAQNNIQNDNSSGNKNNLQNKKNVVCLIGYYSPGTIACMLGIMENFAFMYLSADYTAAEIASLIGKVQPISVIIHENIVNIPEIFHDKIEGNISIFNEKFNIINLKNVNCITLTNMLPRDISYVITTSGSTGVPKIVCVPNKCILPNIADFVKLFDVNKNDVIFCASPLTFDPSIVDLFMAFSTGAQVVLIPSDVLRKPECLLKVLCESKTSILQATPTLLASMNSHNFDNKLLTNATHLRVVALGGEQFPSVSTLQKVITDSSKVRFFNLYGITEVSCWASVEEVFLNEKFGDNRKKDTQDMWLYKYKDKEEKSPSVSIGCPLFDTVIKVFDTERRELNEGKEGELFIGSRDRVCWFKEDNESNLYNSSIIFKDMILRATGDIGVIKDGKIYCFGRKDSVIKRNGQKVSLNEISQKSESISYIVSSFCVVIENIIVLFVVPIFKISEQKVREDLRKILTTWKIPDEIIIVNEIPYNRHGKLNKVKLKEIWNANKINCKKELKKYQLEEFVSQCWFEHTSIHPTRTSNFINSGGTSFSAVHFAQKIEDYFDYQIPGFLELVLMKDFEVVMHELISNTKSKENERDDIKELNPTKRLKKSEENNKLHDIEKNSFNMIDNAPTFKNADENILETIIFVSRRGVYGIKPIVIEKIPKKLSIHWTYDLGKCIDSSPIIVEYSSGNILTLVGSHSHKLACVDVKTGYEVWCLKLSDRIESSPTVSKDGSLCYVGCYGGSFYCINIDTGAIVWTYVTEGDVKSSPCVDLETSDIIFGSHDKHLHCVNAKGDLKWKTKISKGSIFSSPCIGENCVFTATLDGSVACLNKNTGETIWKKTVSKPVFSSIVVFESGIIFGCVSGEIFAYTRSGELIWKQKVEGPIFSSPYVYRISPDFTLICIGTHCKKVLFLNSSGEIIAKYNTNSPVYTTPFLIPVSEKVLLCIFCETSGHLSVLKLIINDNSVGLSLIIEDDLPGEIFASPIMHREYLIVGCRDDKLYCYKVE